jgi:hypothetical protein
MHRTEFLQDRTCIAAFGSMVMLLLRGENFGGQ